MIVIDEKDFIFEEDVILNKKDGTKITAKIRITTEDILTLRDVVNQKVTLEDKELYELIFKKEYKRLEKEIGDYYLESFALQISKGAMAQAGLDMLGKQD